MTANWDWSDFWAAYRVNPSILSDEMWSDMPHFLSNKSTRVQVEILKGAPEGRIKSLLTFLTFDAQIKLLYNK